MTRVAAFFDLDRTLIDVNSGSLWIKHELRAGRITWPQFGQATLWLALYHFSLIDLDRAYGKATEAYRGVPRADLDAWTRGFFGEQIRHRLRPGATAALEAHREAGHPLVILTNSSCFQARAAAEAWGLDAHLGNDFEVDAEGRLTGRPVFPLCYGAGKVHYATRWAEAHDVDLDRSYFYTDSLSDLAMLERVGSPRIVAPDPRLRRLAKRRGWPILEW